MLSELELEVVDSCKIWYCAGFLSWAYIEYSTSIEGLKKGEYPDLSRLLHMHSRMSLWVYDFDSAYSDLLLAPVNPLELEQRAWNLLSHRLHTHVDEFGSYMDSPQSCDKLLEHLTTGWELLQKWNLISESYKAKHEQIWKRVPETEEALKDLIEELGFCHCDSYL